MTFQYHFLTITLDIPAAGYSGQVSIFHFRLGKYSFCLKIFGMHLISHQLIGDKKISYKTTHQLPDS